MRINRKNYEREGSCISVNNNERYDYYSYNDWYFGIRHWFWDG